MSVSAREIAREPAYMEQGDRVRPTTTRPTIYGLEAVISTGHWLTTHAGVRMLMAGGNAFDAAVAAILAASVVEPTSSFSFGSEIVACLSEGGAGSVEILCGQGGAPRAATPEYFAERGLSVVPTGPGRDAPLAFTTPGMVGAVLAILSRFGTKGFAEVVEPALEYAEKGISNYEYMGSRIETSALSQFRLFPPGGADIFFSNGRPNVPGTRLRQPALAATLATLRRAAEGASGSREEKIEAVRRCFYSGVIGQAIVEEATAVGGLLRSEDLSGYTERFEEPVSTVFAGYEVCCQSFWSQAPVMLQVLNMLEALDVGSLRHNSADYVHLVTEVIKLAFADREAFYGDPDFGSVPAAGLLSKDYARVRAGEIDFRNACPQLPEPGKPWQHSGEAEQAVVEVGWGSAPRQLNRIETGTTHISVIDAAGNMVSATPSGGAFDKSVFLSKLGFTLSTRAEMFNLSEGHPNCLAPGKRPRTSLASYIVKRDGRPVMTVGCPGGDAQVQANIQIFLNRVLWRMNPQEAVEAPRFATLSVPNSFYPHSYLRGQLAVETGFSREVKSDLANRGHQVVEVATCGMGAVIASRDEEAGVLATSADPRRSCYAYGW